MSLCNALVLLCVLSVATPSRLPLVVFQHHHPHRHPSDTTEEGESTSVQPPTKLHPYHYHVQDTPANPEDATPPPTPPPSTHHTHPPQTGNEVGEHSLRVLYQVGSSEEDLPVCSPWTVCSKVDMYESPWVERQCRCPGKQSCPTFKSFNDGHTLSDKTRQFKLCEPVKKLPKCRYFRDITWTLITSPDNTTEQVVHCHCPKGAVAYLIKRQGYQTTQGLAGYQYSFACSPQSRLRCQRKEPCRLFTVRKRQELLDEVNTNTLCQCPHSFGCPRHHTDPGVIQGKSYTEEAIKTYSGYCVA